ncbi:hypothetical protein [Acanthopleuribacter pedis]|uniref:LTD domain-containing protein n=1 Tax=Acanthopleuribacter pedis TaxID=442870 RepID=A0A8J7QCN7_9BACT|nr:hypothetical protein [Acanthopleuribacter pedis]MBO1322062.1 hypothetical protein [Acanthopleuribacter pedis]
MFGDTIFSRVRRSAALSLTLALFAGFAASVQAQIFINELDSDQAGTEDREFVELFGPANASLDGHVLVFFNGNGDVSYNTIDLDGQTLDANGFFVIGGSGIPGANLPLSNSALQNGADAVALYQDVPGSFPNGTAPTTTNLVDAVVYDTNDGDDAGLLILLNAGQPQVNEDGNSDKDNHSIARFPDGGTQRNTDTYVAQLPTPGATNGGAPPVIVINELDADQAGTEDREFVELFGPANASLDGHVLVFFNGNGDVSYNTIDLDGQTLDANGFFVVGGSGIPGADLPLSTGSLQNGADAVALYQDVPGSFPNGTAPTTTNLVDAVVYDTNDGDDAGLLILLNAGQPQVNEDGNSDKDNHSIARLPDGGTPRNTDTYVAQAPTPGAPNPGGPSAPEVVINELDSDQAGTEDREFVELFGLANTSLDGLIMVFFNGSSDTSYHTIDLSGQSLDGDGFFVVGGAGIAGADLPLPDTTLQNGADAVAIYQDVPGNFPDGSAVTTNNLVDAVVYGTGDPDDAGLLVLLNAGQPQVDEDGNADKDNHSIARLPDGGTARNTDTYDAQDPTPGGPNVPPLGPTIVINELDADQAGTEDREFVELFGPANTSLDGHVLVFFNGNGDTSYLTIDLAGQSLDANGFFVVGGSGITQASLPLADFALQNGADAVALYADVPGSFPNGTAVTTTNLVDAVVYDTNDNDDAGLLSLLNAGQLQVNEDGSGDKDNHSIARLPDGGTPRNTNTYVAQTPTPGESNRIIPPVVINELDADQAGTEDREFIELHGPANFSLDGLVLVLYNGNGDVSYNAIDLTGQSLNGEGFFVIGGAGISQAGLPLPTGSLQNGADAVALYLGTPASFPNGTAVTTDDLVDALVYDTGDSDDAGLLVLLNAGQSQVDEDGAGDKDNHSVARVPDGGTRRDTSTYVAQIPTPGETNVPPTVLTIAEIQGNGLASPQDGNTVRTEGNVVTVVGDSGFFMQTPDANVDADPETSEGIFVFLDAAPTVSVGDIVNVEGPVVEFFDFTEFTGAGITVDIISSGNPLPTPIQLDATLPSPNQPQADTALERFEGMLVTMSGIATGPTDQFGDTAVVAGSQDRAFIEPGIAFPGRAGQPVFDGNPQVFEINSDQLGTPRVQIHAGQTITEATGGFGFSFGDFQIWPSTLTVGPANFDPTPVRTRQSGEFTVASQNMLRLYDDQDNGNGDSVTPTNEYNLRLGKFSLWIRTVMGAPDILALQEVESLAVLQDLAARINADDGTITYTAQLLDGNDPGAINVGYLVRDNVTVNSLTQVQASETFSFNSNTFDLHDRPPLVLNATVTAGTNTTEITVINIHNRSLNDIDEDPGSGEFVRTKRNLQATRISEYIQDLQTATPTVNLIVLGDFNAYQFTDGFVDALGQISGIPDPLGSLVPATVVVDPPLRNHVLDLPAEERYSFVFDGSANALDHVLSSQNGTCLVSGVQYARGNADMPRDLDEDGATAARSSDHDGIVAFIGPRPSLNVTPTAGLTVDESGTTTAMLQVSLSAAPSGDVTVTVTSSDTGEATVDTAMLTFNSTNFGTPQMVTVTGVQDNTIDGDQNFTITVSATSGDACFSSLTPVSVSGTTSEGSVTGFTVVQTGTNTIRITGPPNSDVGVYYFDPATDTWILIGGTTLDGNGNGTITGTLPQDVAIGVGSSDGSVLPTEVLFVTVPTLGEWALMFLLAAMAATAMVIGRRNRHA